MNKKIYKWFLLILNVFILSLTIYFFILGSKLNNGGLDGLSLLTVQFLKLFLGNISSENRDIFIIIFIFFYNIITLFIAYIFLGKKFCQRIIFLVFLLNFFMFFWNLIIGYEAREKILFFLKFKWDKYQIIFLLISSILSGFFIGYTLSNIRNLNYNTGGMDILQRILKNVYNLNYILIILLTDGVIILLSSFLESSQCLIIFFVRLFFSFFALIILGYIMDKNYFPQNNLDKK
ncbi:MAG: YitT family protein [Candidatus Phytoplasma stylosanthis]|uniref:YitT family protein n=2 Tax=Candidatus Phytoplasma stylosanthis TaxID=2798314 RepID=UPI00293A1552|nr:YitT family protein [Candidatus Phytoplasma stylosanthis]MDV3170767.1 YitT family protein [Candidatus Phytoplasma stylosanthis]MDV3173846.1 YitT family protein [Candidatus Phytoplasma stylosanthis]MDV3174279.1 YitT family protein [Candidatus Phytoplasma stylosanthis]MDV3202744.1 YitT family protein [Candidatus Phytoplasma stylosanthis]